MTLERCPPSAWNRVRHRVEYAGDAQLPVDNNHIENQIRPIAIGRNYPRFAIMEDSTRRARRGPPGDRLRRDVFVEYRNVASRVRAAMNHP